MDAPTSPLKPGTRVRYTGPDRVSFPSGTKTVVVLDPTIPHSVWVEGHARPPVKVAYPHLELLDPPQPAAADGEGGVQEQVTLERAVGIIQAALEQAEGAECTFEEATELGTRCLGFLCANGTPLSVSINVTP